MIETHPPARPTLVLSPEHDQFTTPDIARTTVEGWPTGEMWVVAGADNVLAGRTDLVATAAGDWLADFR